ncbi:hypothetical protein CXG81DRAFT_28293 [Caulochytrium protostelioides]|uniref:Peroxisomal biogenesis factor 11 n=1 Tax=Caulochytrium protostelioides TaxID=1555241 RepID=A0A4P9X1H0_9FUNG|nr:hypothetical protein CXG81DRAFT_28293 [Caulochytrium protostelioides]|eukprot:RKO98915.1 hypothetical protein CXG81DRAFT_28293 [Caulochytrium protostelioides]
MAASVTTKPAAGSVLAKLETRLQARAQQAQTTPAFQSLLKTIRFTSSLRGTDKVFMLIQYVAKILIWFCRRTAVTSGLAVRIAALAAPIADTRILLRYAGLLPLASWAVEVEADALKAKQTSLPPAASELSPAEHRRRQFRRLWLNRLQILANTLYYPLEHLYWLGAHAVLPIGTPRLNAIGMWSCRFWAAYVVLYFADLAEQARILRQRQRALKAFTRGAASAPAATLAGPGGVEPHADAAADASETVVTAETRLALQQAARMDLERDHATWMTQLVVNAAYFPLTLHWSHPVGLLSDLAVGVCGTVAAVAQLATAWDAT